MRCYICQEPSDTFVTQRFRAEEATYFINGKPPKVAVCFDCMMNRRGCISAWQNKMVCICPRCDREGGVAGNHRANPKQL